MDGNPKVLENKEEFSNEEELVNRRAFLLGLGKWSLAVIGGALLGGALLNPKEEANAAVAWANRGGGGGAWANRRGGGGAWANGGGGWINRGAGWANRGTAWVNRY